MSGGNQAFSRSACARRLASGLLGSMLVAPWGTAVAPLLAEPVVDAGAAAVAAKESTSKRPEKSIVNAVRTSETADFVVASDDTTAAELEPIAVTSDKQPDLADPPFDPSVPAPPPTLADEYAVIASDKEEFSDDEGELDAESFEVIADDECLDESVTATGKDVMGHIEVAQFNGATPGVTTRDELVAKWGQPAQSSASGQALVYKLPGFAGVNVRFTSDRLDSLRIALAAPTNAADLVVKLGLSTIRPAVMTDELGTPLSTAFPERGVTFVHCEGSGGFALHRDATVVASDPAVEAIVIRPIQAGSFLLRAETSPGRAYSCRIADLEKVLELQPTSAHARWLLSATKLAAGAGASAEKLAREAVDLDPRNDDYRLQWVRSLKYLARYDQAVAQTKSIIEGSTATPIQRAQALEQMALLASLGSKTVQEQAVPLHNKAIALADPLATSEDPATRVAANQLLLGAHLAIAEQVARGDYQDKQKFVAQWISRASALAEQMIEAGEADVSLRLQVAITALDAGAKLDPPIDPKLWIDEAEQAFAAMPSDVDDPLAQAEVDWQMGLAYLHAAEISHRRGRADDALDYGAFADAKIGAAQDARQEMPDTQFVLGRLYFQIGAVHAVHRSDHAEACKWYDRAIEPLSRPVPVTPLAAPGQHADALVSMAVSFWETGDRERAYELTGAGVELVEQGISEGLLTEVALEVPKNNFAAMSRALGRTPLETPQATPAAATQVAQQPAAPAKKTVARVNIPTERTPVRTATRRAAAASGVQRR